MNRTITVLLAIGLGGVLVAVMLAVMGVEALERTGRGKLIRLAGRIKERYAFQEVRIRSFSDANTEIEVWYRTNKYLSFAEEKVQAELKDVADFVYGQAPAKEIDLTSLKTVQVVREERLGGGCFEKVNRARAAFGPPR